MEEKERKTASRSKLRWRLLLIISCLGVISLWGANFFVLYCFEPTQRGTYGDMFGAVNALFTGLAFAGLIISILLQQKQINQIEEDNEHRRKTEQVNETLEQCQYYLTEMQSTFRELSMNNIIAQGFLP